MVLVNENFLKLEESYLFAEIARRVETFRASHPKEKLIRLGIGDVTEPLPQAVIQAMHKAVDEMGRRESFHGYAPDQGYDFLRETIVKNDYETRGIHVDMDEIFVSDGAKCDTGNIGDILAQGNRVALTDPVYPVYVDTNRMAGRSIAYLPSTAENGFRPPLPDEPADVIYLCYPNNPTGTTLPREELKRWVDYALENRSLILYDAAYEAYIRQADVPHSIYEIEGARRVAIEFRSFSKTAGFTGQRCAFTVVPHELEGYTAAGKQIALHGLWSRRTSTKFNGVSYVTQRGAQAVYSPEGQAQVKATVDYYMENARILREGLQACGWEVYGGTDAPYIWLRTPRGVSSWEFFGQLLSKLHIVGTPGVGFGPSGEGYLRLTAFGRREDTLEATERLRKF
ncbi:MAG: LL-diaminopimelate aminotransferase [Tannerella sp.]|jgi:LL-diaminopimelate aminotransferase|nr:LL-diaminopimelate aminotransferase [Tannerella sp.]